MVIINISYLIFIIVLKIFNRSCLALLLSQNNTKKDFQGFVIFHDKRFANIMCS